MYNNSNDNIIGAPQLSDSFEELCADLMNFSASTVELLGKLSKSPDTGNGFREALAVAAQFGAQVNVNFALRGLELSIEANKAEAEVTEDRSAPITQEFDDEVGNGVGDDYYAEVAAEVIPDPAPAEATAAAPAVDPVEHFNDTADLSELVG